MEDLPVPTEVLDSLPVPVASEVLLRLRDQDGFLFLRYPHPRAEEAGLVPMIARKHVPEGVPKGVVISSAGVHVYPERRPIPLSHFLRELLSRVPSLIESLHEVCRALAREHPNLFQGFVAQAPDRTFPPGREAWVEEGDGRKRPLTVTIAPGM